MRPPLTLDPDVMQLLEEEVRRRGKTLRAVVNDVLRTGLKPARRSTGAPPPFRVEPHDFGFKPGIDLDKLHRLLDELEAQETAERLAS